METDYFSMAGYGRKYPTRVISGQSILELNSEQEQRLIGHTLDYYNELESALNEAITKAEGYYARLVELGDIVPPKTPEELVREQAAAQQEINATLLKTIQKLTDKIDRLEGDTNARLSADSNDSNAGILAENGKPGGKGTKKLHAGQGGAEKADQ